MSMKAAATYVATLLGILAGVSQRVREIIAQPRLSAAEKLGGKKLQITWSLPAGKAFSCVGETSVCRDGCYSKSGRHLFNSNFHKVILGNWKWLEAWRADGNIEVPAHMLAQEIITEYFRIHESGDFFAQWDVDLWTRVAELKPHTRFWFYTRSFSLDFSKLLALPNVQGFASCDRENKDAARRWKARYQDLGALLAYGPWDVESQRRQFLGTGSILPQGSFLCPAVTKKIEMTAACLKCKLCLVKGRTDRDVVFLEHVSTGVKRFEC